MLRLRFISLLLAMVLSIQMLPIAQIGLALSNNTWTEELPHNASEDTKADNSHTFVPQIHHFASELSFSAANLYIHLSEQIPSNHSTDVVSPPPDAA